MKKIDVKLLQKLYDNKTIKFLERYEEKYKTYILHN